MDLLSESSHSFEQLCLPLRPELYNFALRLNRHNKHRAEDVVQDSLIRAWKAWPRWVPGDLTPEAAVRAWLYRIVANTFTNAYQNDKMHQRVHKHNFHEIVDNLYDGPTKNVLFAREPSIKNDAYKTDQIGKQRSVTRLVDGDHTKFDPELSDEVRTAISYLHPERRVVVERFYFQDQTSEEIAAALNISAITVRTRLLRARERLMPLLERFAKQNYRLARRVDPLKQSSKVEKTKPDCIKAIVRDGNHRTLRVVKASPNFATAR